MTHRALLQRDIQTTTNPHGHKGPPSWATHVAALPCFLYVAAVGRSGREAVAAERTAAVRSYALLVPLDTDVTERDRVNGVTRRDGEVILSGVMNIRAVTRHEGHIELELEAVR